MKIKRAITQSKKVASALNFTTLTDQQAEDLYKAFYNSFRGDFKKLKPRPNLKVINGGKK